ncbi:hypothetical protein DYBT9623_04470 [Dyadobacter sp. CECT 9623]|uniref:PPM-type phosphatase domain-containing protein n=1 Tax=Dyadobacter linearis TaxID=2823330 RepID=A0ABN7RI47_9BACT|nr:hypothetical protein [Dyadobacter sp. CECT 9623]CAG5072934.1 hypothetical protein DYBT9623_04470 [Dyadobacter sp. CECT 9623]
MRKTIQKSDSKKNVNAWRPNSPSILSEIFMSAGPRKNSSDDTELGEDVVGISSGFNRTFFWLMDGTSESSSVGSSTEEDEQEINYVFSSRLLAQELSYFFQQNCEKERIAKLVTSAIRVIKIKWLEELNKLPEQKRTDISDYLSKGLNIRCSSTLVFGYFSSAGELQYVNYGDSNVIPISNAKHLNIPILEPTANRIILQLSIKNGLFDIESNNIDDIEEHLYFVRNIRIVYVFSDGIGKLMQSRLKSSLGNNEALVRAVMAKAPHKTYDDKSLIILKRKLIGR